MHLQGRALKVNGIIRVGFGEKEKQREDPPRGREYLFKVGSKGDFVRCIYRMLSTSSTVHVLGFQMETIIIQTQKKYKSMEFC